jgi:hypothetical protein
MLILMTAAPSSPVQERTLLTRVRRMAGLIPTPWLITAGGAVLLATTAGFGGLADAAVAPVPTVAVGEQYTGSDLTMTVQSVELRTDRGNAFVFPKEEKGEKVLAVTVDVVNTFHTPRSANSKEAAAGIRVKGIDGAPTVSRADGSSGLTMQPDVPVRLVVAWIVDRGELHDGDQVRLSLPDATHFVGTNVLKGQDYWSDLAVGATLTTAVDEIPPDDDGSAL